MNNRPNILLITIDTLRWDMLGCNGYDPSLTPNLDRLASKSVRFTQAITGGSWTQAAFPVILTSTYASMYGGCLGPLSPERPSPVETLAAHGYNTAGFSTNPHLSRRSGYARGFDYFADLTPDETDPRLRWMKGGQRLLRSPLFHRLLGPFGMRLRPARIYSSAAEVTDSVCRWLDTAEAPFFAWAHYMDLHWPYHLEETLQAADDIAQAWQDLAIMFDRSNFNEKGTVSPAQRDHFIALYVHSLRYLDAQIGRLLHFLDNTEHGANTVILVVSDHGEEFLEHGRWGHWESNLYDEIIKVPLLIHLPDSGHAQVITQQVSLLDLMPTVFDLCSCPDPEGVLGTSLKPLWSGKGKYNVEITVTEMQRSPWHRVSMRTNRFKFIWDSKRPDHPDLFDLATDPSERRSVGEEHPQEMARFKAQVEDHLSHSAQTQPNTGPVHLGHDAAIARRLRDLGYVE